MEARFFCRPQLRHAISALMLCCVCSPVAAQFGRQRQYTAQSENFIVFASSPQWAAQVAEVAELNRRQLAIHWLGSELPAWSERVPVHVQAAPNLGAGGETRFSLIGGTRVGNWMMSVQGTQERILDSVLPHEITHTIFATHFAPLGKYVPRWADEGACTTVEHESEKRKHQHFLHEFLRTGRGLAFNQMFSLKEYPADILPLYAQGHSAVQFLIDQGGSLKFVKFLEAGMRSEAWPATLQKFYGYDSIGQFQTLWNQWLADGSPEDLLAYAPGLQNGAAQVAATLVSDSPISQDSIALAAAHSPSQNPQPVGALAVATRPAAGRGSDSWYKRRLAEVSGVTVAAAPAGSGAAASTPPSQADMGRENSLGFPHRGPSQDARLPAGQATARPQAGESFGVQVLDWGSSVPVPGIQQSGAAPQSSWQR